MDHPAVHLGATFMAFFAIMNPIANAPIFLGLVEDQPAALQRGIALRAVLLAFGIVAVFAIGGRAIFDLFGITLPAFRIAGGILVALVGFGMLHGEPSKIHATTDEDNEASRDAALGLAVSPLAMPVLAGPGTIATAMSFAAEATGAEVVRVLAAFGAVCALTFVVFAFGSQLTRFLGQNAINVVARLMGLVLTVIGVQMLIEGIEGAIRAAMAGGAI